MNTDINIENSINHTLKKKTKKTSDKLNIYEEYLNYHDKYKNKYGDKALVLMQVGSFYETYATETLGPNLFKLSELLNIVCTKKDKSVQIIDTKNPFLLGFPAVSLSKYLKILIDNNYVVVIIDQITPFPKPTRAVVGVYSSSTYIDNITVESKYLMILYIEINQSINSSKNNISIGMCSIDSSTGFINYYESHGSGILDENEAILEAQRYYHYFRPSELIIYEIDNTRNSSTNIEKKIIDKIDILPNQTMFNYNKINPDFIKVNYQIKCLDKIYKDITNLSNPIEFFDLEKTPYAIIALIAGFDYIKQHNENLLNELSSPIYFNEHKYMILANNAQYQLNIVDYYNFDTQNIKYQSLNDVINNCVTPMGKRFLKQRLCAPFTDANTINNYYELTDKIIETGKVDTFRNYLKSLADLDKLFRKITVKFIQPFELFNIFSSFEQIIQLIQMLLQSNLKTDIYKLFTKSNIVSFNNCVNYIQNTFLIDKIKSNNLVDIKETIYKNGIHSDIDNVQFKISSGVILLENITKALEKFDNDLILYLKYNERDGYYLQTTLKKGKKLKGLVENISQIQVNDTTVIDGKKLVFTFLTDSVKITYPELNIHSDEMDELYLQLNILTKQVFYNDVLNWYHLYSNVFKKLINLITIIDVICNNAYTSNKFHYVKPTIISSSEDSFINAKQLRHPIIERIIDYEYVPHDIALDDTYHGIMIYGPNSAGKSAIMKAIALSLIMAQCGLFVPAEQFEFNIFTALYTRISGNDNLFKGQSSFMIEMNELRNILKKANNKSLVVGDEIARGSEYLSASSIVASAIMRLSKLGTKFLFATHLHDLPKLKEIKELHNIRFVYLSVEQVNGELVFSRKLLDGTGDNVYGITIAKYILDDPEFIETAIKFKNELLENQGINYKLVNNKKSLYNKNIYVDQCYICHSDNNLETHHINFQKNFTKTSNGLVNINKKHILKDDQANLIVLCNNCHDDLHSGKIKIKGLVQTTKGIQAVLE